MERRMMNFYGADDNKMEKLIYLGSILQKNGKIVEGVASRIRCGRLKWQVAKGVLCNKKVLFKVKGKFFKIIVRPSMLYELKGWVINKKEERKR